MRQMEPKPQTPHKHLQRPSSDSGQEGKDCVLTVLQGWGGRGEQCRGRQCRGRQCRGGNAGGGKGRGGASAAASWEGPKIIRPGGIHVIRRSWHSGSGNRSQDTAAQSSRDLQFPREFRLTSLPESEFSGLECSLGPGISALRK